MTRWSFCLCAALLMVSSCTSDGGPGTESPVNAGVGGIGGEGDSGTGGDSGSAGAAAGGIGGGAAGVGGVAGVAGGQGGAGGMASGQGGSGGDQSGGIGGGGPNADDDAGADDEGYCTTACTGIAPDEGVSEACAMNTSRDDCAMFETGGFPASCRWVTPDSEPCLAP